MDNSFLNEKINNEFFEPANDNQSAIVPLLFACIDNSMLKNHLQSIFQKHIQISNSNNNKIDSSDNNKFNEIDLSASNNKSKYSSLSILTDAAFTILLEILTPTTDNSSNSNKNIPDIQSVNLSWCTAITDSSIAQLSHRFGSSIQFMNMSFTNITDKAVEDIVLCCKNLKLLNLTGCQHLSDKSLDKLAQYGTSILSLELRSCQQLSEKKFFNCAKKMVGFHLNKLNIRDCIVSEKIVLKLRNLSPAFTVVAPSGDSTISSPLSYIIET